MEPLKGKKKKKGSSVFQYLQIQIIWIENVLNSCILLNEDN